MKSGSLFDVCEDEFDLVHATSGMQSEDYLDVDTRWEYLQRSQDLLAWREVEYSPPQPMVPVAAQVEAQNRRAVVSGSDGDLTTKQWLSWVTALGGRCVYCGTEMHKPTIEHVLPVSRGGGTNANNVVPACRVCNSMKGDKTPDEWLSPKLFRHFVMKIMTANRIMVFE